MITVWQEPKHGGQPRTWIPREVPFAFPDKLPAAPFDIHRVTGLGAIKCSWLHDRGLEGSQELSVGLPVGWAISNSDSLDGAPKELAYPWHQTSHHPSLSEFPRILLVCLCQGPVRRAERAYEQKAGNPREGGGRSCTICLCWKGCQSLTWRLWSHQSDDPVG